MFSLDNVAFWALAVSILTHAAATIWWASSLNAKVGRLERDVKDIEIDEAKIRETLGSLHGVMSRLEERTEILVQTMLRLENKLAK